jgi:tetratricopeptide (TPR) repeat protein
MVLLYVFLGIVVAGALINLFFSFLYKTTKKLKENNSPYFKLKNKLEEELLQATFLGDWKRRQEITLYLIWLDTIKKVESNNASNRISNKNKESIFTQLSPDNIKLPNKWDLYDFYCYPFSQEIISAYGKVLAENDYKGIYKPDSILPVPKHYIKKAILFTFDYLNLKESIYEVTEKNKRADNLNTVNTFLEVSFIDTGNCDLPKSSIENFNVGDVIKEKLPKRNELDDLNLIDWRSETDWIVQGVHYAEKKQYHYAFACYENARKISPESNQLNEILSLTYLTKGEEHHDKGESELALENIKKAAELKNNEAIKWLEQYSK